MTTEIKIEKPDEYIRNELESLALSFDGFENELKANKTKRKDNENKQIIELKADLSTINNDIQLETKKREEICNAISSMYQNEIKIIKNDIEKSFDIQINKLYKIIDELHIKIDKIEEKHEKDREKFPKLIENSTSNLLKEINDFKAQFNAEIKNRESQDKIIPKIINEQEYRVKQFIELERIEREKKLIDIKKYIDEEQNIRQKSYKSINEYLKENIIDVHKRIDETINKREQTTSEVVKAMVHYTAALHDGVRIVSEAS